MKRFRPKPSFELTAGCLCLDFANTLDERSSDHPQDKLQGYPALVAFGQQTGVFTTAEARRLEREGLERQTEASVLFREALGLREMVYRIMSAVAAGNAASAEDVADFNALLGQLHAGSIVPAPGQAAWRYQESTSGGSRLIERIVRSAAEVLISDGIRRVKRCAAGTCSWLFLDRSRSRNRRWCEMRTCGSRNKARTYYQRKTAAEKTASEKPVASDRRTQEALRSPR